MIGIGLRYKFHCEMPGGPNPASTWRAGYFAHNGHTVVVTHLVSSHRGDNAVYAIRAEKDGWKGAAFENELEAIR